MDSGALRLPHLATLDDGLTSGSPRESKGLRAGGDMPGPEGGGASMPPGKKAS